MPKEGVIVTRIPSTEEPTHSPPHVHRAGSETGEEGDTREGLT
jgi:hypothetical protein